MIDTGDSVRHGPTGETWVVAYVDGDNLAWVGWPEGEARLSDCTLIEKATPDERLRFLCMMADGGASADRRVRYAKRILAAMDSPAPTPQSVVNDALISDAFPTP